MAIAPGVVSPEDDDLYPESDGKPMAETDLHRQIMMYCIEALKIHFQARLDVYVSGNNFLYYQRGNPRAVVSPDCYVVFGRDSALRNTYKTWEEAEILPAFVLEVTSQTTRKEDVRSKRPLYEGTLQIPEYFLFDPTGDYLKPRLQGFRMGMGRYEALALENDSLHSEQLELDLRIEGNWLRLFDPILQEPLLTVLEREQALQETRLRAETAELRAESAEEEIARLRAELDALRNRS